MIRRELWADTETPVSLFLALQGGMRSAALFESVEGQERWARRSLIALSREAPLAAHEMSEVRALAAGLPAKAESLLDGAFGYFTYEAAQAFLPLAGLPRGDGPLAEFFRPETVLLYDHREHVVEALFRDRDIEAHVMERLAAGGRPPPVPFVPERRSPAARAMSSETYQAQVVKAKDYIAAGDAFQIVVSQRFDIGGAEHDLLATYRRLRRQNPSPYLFYFRTPNLEAAGASPETLIRVEDDAVTVRPIAGTRPRGKSDAEDRALAAGLLQDPKERAEHVMLVDLGRNDVGRVAAAGSVTVDPMMSVERYSHVMHLVSEVHGRLRPECTALDAFASAFPAGTLSGAPKIRAMQIIAELEGTPRGLYGGAVGYFADARTCDFAIAIRTVFRPLAGAGADAGCVVQAGAGIVYDSDPAEEDRECLRKAQSALQALGAELSGPKPHKDDA